MDCTRESHEVIKADIEKLTTMTRPIAPQRDRNGNVMVYLCLCCQCDSSLGFIPDECDEAVEAFFRLHGPTLVDPPV